MAAALLRGGASLLRLRLQHHRLAVGVLSQLRRPWCAATESNLLNQEASSAKKTTAALNARDPPKHTTGDDSEHQEWKEKKAEILKDIEPIVTLAKEIIHSNRYKDGACLTAEDEEAVVKKLLAYHPNSEDKIGCGLDFVVVDRHPQFRQSRCLFVVRTDGEWMDFSYHKCLQAYIRDRYPAYAESFIKEHFKHGSKYRVSN
uniref:Protein DCLic n=1 Tax=Rhizophora mucronata TaxID=61149 RepID=A0A2P2JP33_RHIMU